MIESTSPDTTLTVAVLICSYMRPFDLARCLEGFKHQLRPADDIIVVVRSTDHSTLSYLDDRIPDILPIRVIPVIDPGTVAARNAGLRSNNCDIIAMLDDDAVPHPDWLSRIVDHFRLDCTLGALGGRDRCFVDDVPEPATQEVVGKLLWNGNCVGNHSLGSGPPRRVDTLKGANMSFRLKAVSTICFDQRLRGRGAQACEDLAFSRSVSILGWLVKYDPAVLVDHYEGPRTETRHYASEISQDWEGFSDSVYNQVVAIWDSLTPVQHLVSILYFVVVGTRVSPGFIQALRFTPTLGGASWKRFALAAYSRILAYHNLMTNV